MKQKIYDKECEVHPKFLESGYKKNKTKMVKCGKCKILLLTKRTEKFKLDNLLPVKIKFEISDNDLKDSYPRVGEYIGFPDETYANKNLTLFKHGDTMIVKKNKTYKNNITWEDFTPLWIALLKQHEGDELVQCWLLQNNLTLFHRSEVLVK